MTSRRATVTVSDHGFSVGDTIIVTGGRFKGRARIIATSPNQFTTEPLSFWEEVWARARWAAVRAAREAAWAAVAIATGAAVGLAARLALGLL